MTASFPPGGWIPDIGQPRKVAGALLEVVTTALDLYGDGKTYARVVLAHGTVAPIPPKDGGQVAVVLPKIALGQAGREEYGFTSGDPGAYGFHFAQYTVSIARSWPTVKGGIAPGLPAPVAQAAAIERLWDDGWIMWSALRAFALGGVTSDLVPPVGQNQVHVGPMTPRGPLGARAAWNVDVKVQL